MKIEQQTSGLEQSKRLIQLGIDNNSTFYHIVNYAITGGYEGIKLYSNTKSYKIRGTVENGGAIRYYAAFTVAELGVMMPHWIRLNSNVNNAELIIRKDFDTWNVAYDQDCPTEGGYGPTVKDIYCGWFQSEIQAMAMTECLIYLLENNHITAEECNQRLKG